MLKILKTRIVIIILAAIIFVGGIYFFLHRNRSMPQMITVVRHSITESVSVTGNTTPIQSVSLGFQGGGVISHIYSSVGQVVSVGQTLAELNINDLQAQLDQAQANVNIQEAKLESMKLGSRPEDIATTQAALNKSIQDLSNMYLSVSDLSNDSYVKANDAVRTQIDSLFSSPETNSISLTFNTNNAQAGINSKNERNTAGTVLNSWQKELAIISPTSSNDFLDTTLQKEIDYLSSVRQLLLDISSALDSSINIGSATLDADKAEVTSALNEVNTAAKNLNTLSQNISSQKLVVAETQANLSLKKAGTLQQDIDGQMAQIDQARAAVSSVEARISNSRILAPISGTVTQFDAKIGQVAVIGTPLVSIISNNQFEVDTEVPETDIGKIAIDDPISMTFDAFPDGTFSGKLFYIDPAQTISEGVVDYKVKIMFDSIDKRMKSGLTANIKIKTRTNDNSLVLPQYAVLQNNDGVFVQKLIGGVASNTPVKIGIQDEDGNVEILSGVIEGEKVINVGLK